MNDSIKINVFIVKGFTFNDIFIGPRRLRNTSVISCPSNRLVCTFKNQITPLIEYLHTNGLKWSAPHIQHIICTITVWRKSTWNGHIIRCKNVNVFTKCICTSILTNSR